MKTSTVDLVVTGDETAAVAAAVDAVRRGERVLVVLGSADAPVIPRLRWLSRATKNQLTVMRNAEVVCVDGVNGVEAVVVRYARTGRLCAVSAYEAAVREFTITARRYTFTPARIEVNKDDLVRITLIAEDVPHGFAIDEYRIAKRALPGRNTLEFRADRAGRFAFYCCITSDERWQGNSWRVDRPLISDGVLYALFLIRSRSRNDLANALVSPSSEASARRKRASARSILPSTRTRSAATAKAAGRSRRGIRAPASITGATPCSSINVLDVQSAVQCRCRRAGGIVASTR